VALHWRVRFVPTFVAQSLQGLRRLWTSRQALVRPPLELAQPRAPLELVLAQLRLPMPRLPTQLLTLLELLLQSLALPQPANLLVALP
jgi:hypothetical protein